METENISKQKQNQSKAVPQMSTYWSRVINETIKKISTQEYNRRKDEGKIKDKLQHTQPLFVE